jgi:hypothetical protein
VRVPCRPDIRSLQLKIRFTGFAVNDAECASVNVDDVNALVALAERLKPDLTSVAHFFEKFFSI